MSTLGGKAIEIPLEHKHKLKSERISEGSLPTPAFWRWCFLSLLFAFGGFLLYLILKTSNEVAGSRYFVLPDDGMISMRFARNLASGLGLVWNAGERRVQGFTNFAWTLIMAVVLLVGVPDRLASLPMQLASLGIHLLTVFYIWWRVSKRNGPSLGIGAAAAYLASSCSVCWAISGWETSAVALGWALALDPVLDDESRAPAVWRSLVVAGLTVVFRPDAALLLGALALYWVATANRTERWTAILAAIVAAAPALALGIFQREYYGSWVPNTAILKRSAGILSVRLGIEYVLTSLLRYPLNGAALFGGIFGARRLRTPKIALLASLAGTYLIYVVSVGGDVFSHARFLLPLLPTAIVLATDGLSRIQLTSDPRRQFLIKAVTVSMIALIAFDFADEVLVDVPAQKSLNRQALNTALALRDLSVNRKPLVGIFLAGTIPYFNPSIRFHDMLGKNDVHIAQSRPHSGEPGHNRWDYDYSLDQVRPDLIITSYPILKQKPSLRETGFRLDAEFYRDLYNQSQFVDLYLDHQVPLRFDGEEVYMYEAYARKGGVFDPLKPGAAP
jgi:arabinofuranosyltransferase